MTKTLLPAILFLLKPKNNFVFKLFHGTQVIPKWLVRQTMPINSANKI
jgi:hypothetical protein